MLTQPMLPHNWRELMAEAGRLGVGVVATARKRNGESLREINCEISDLVAEAQAMHDLLEKEERGPTDEEQTRFDEIMGKQLDGTEGELHELKKERAGIEAHLNRIKDLALQQDALRDPNRNPLDGPGQPIQRGPEAITSTTPALSFRDAHTGQMVTPLALGDRFAPEANYDPYGGTEPQASLGERIVSHLTGRPVAGVRAETALFEGTDGQGGFLLTPEVFGPVIDLARPAAVAFRAGATTLPMTTSELQLVQQLSDPEAHWTPELGKVPSSSMSFGKIILRPKKLAALIPLSLEMLEDAANAATLVERAIRARMALALDQAILSGAGAGAEPLGIRNVASVNEVPASDPILDFADLESAVEQIESANYAGELSSLAWLSNPRDASQYRRLQAGDGQPLTPTPGAAALQRYSTTSLPEDADGSGNSEMIVGDMSQVVVGMRTNAQLRFLPAGTVSDAGGNQINATEQFATVLAVHMRADVAVIRPEWLTVVRGVNWT